MTTNSKTLETLVENYMRTCGKSDCTAPREALSKKAKELEDDGSTRNLRDFVAVLLWEPSPI